MDEKLQDLVLAFRASGKGREAVLERIAALLYGEPHRFGFDDRDEAAEALERYRERIAGLAERFVDRGTPFEGYLASSLRFLAKSLRRERRKCRERELVCERAESWACEEREALRPLGAAGFEGCDDDPAKLLPQGLTVARLNALRSRLVYLYVKCAWEAEDGETRRVAAATGVPLEWLAAATAQARRSLEAERLRYERLSLRRDRSWSRLRLLEGRQAEACDLAERRRVGEAIAKEKLRLESTRRAIKDFHPLVPNSVVARILGIPKGTVDSGLYYLKKSLPGLEAARLPKKAPLRRARRTGRAASVASATALSLSHPKD
ncbi:MAG: hypothetical protein JNG85_00295 [Spirochaetaceae bacterium]|nr:hypothetical protein [Spirochaetaceae bacterium]